MKIAIDHHYDCDVETVFALISDPDFIVRKLTAIGGRDVSADKADNGEGGLEVVTRRTVDVDLPGFAKKVVQPIQSAVQTETWSAPGAGGARSCSFSVEAQGAPGRIWGTHTLSPASDGGSDHHIDIEIKVSIPLVGGKIEGLAADTARADLAEQFDYTDKELAAG